MVVLFKHHNTYFYSHVFPQHLNNITRTILPNKILRGVKLEHQLVLESPKWKQQGNHSFFFLLYGLRSHAIPIALTSALEIIYQLQWKDTLAILVTLFFFFIFSTPFLLFRFTKFKKYLSSTRKICGWILFLFFTKSLWLHPKTTESSTPSPLVLFGLAFSATIVGGTSHWHHHYSWLPSSLSLSL